MNNKDSFSLKADFMPLTVIQLSSFDHDRFKLEWEKKLKQAPNYFTNAPVVIDVSSMNQDDVLDLSELCGILKNSNIIPVGIKGLTKKNLPVAEQHGLAIIQNQIKQNVNSDNKPEKKNITPKSSINRCDQDLKFTSKDGDLVILSSVNTGAEVIADGNIHIYGPLRGRALAGARGNTQARIFCKKLEAELISIAGHYLVKEHIQVPNTRKNYYPNLPNRATTHNRGNIDGKSNCSNIWKRWSR